MLPTIDFQNLNLENFSIDIKEIAELPADAVTFAASIATHLPQPIQVAPGDLPLLAGTPLPQTGKPLPALPEEGAAETRDIPLAARLPDPLRLIATGVDIKAAVDLGDTTHEFSADLRQNPATTELPRPVPPPARRVALPTSTAQQMPLQGLDEASSDALQARPMPIAADQVPQRADLHFSRGEPVMSADRRPAAESVAPSLSRDETPVEVSRLTGDSNASSSSHREVTVIRNPSHAAIEAAAPVNAAADKAPPVLAPTMRPILSATPTTSTVELPVADPAWGDAIGQRVVMMASRNIQSADIRLSPQELGPLSVRVSVEDGAAEVTFIAQHAQTREALETALPRLRELFQENGLSLSHTSVGDQGVQQDGAETAAPPQDALPGELDAEAVSSNDGRSVARRADALVDTFA